jgi:hypothetical protein
LFEDEEEERMYCFDYLQEQFMEEKQAVVNAAENATKAFQMEDMNGSSALLSD